MRLSTIARLGAASTALASTILFSSAAGATSYVDIYGNAPVIPEGGYDFSVEQPPCFLDDYSVRATGMSLETAQALILFPELYTGMPWCEPTLGVYYQADWDLNGNGLIDSLEEPGDEPTDPDQTNSGDATNVNTTDTTVDVTNTPAPTTTTGQALGAATVAQPATLPKTGAAESIPAAIATLSAAAGHVVTRRRAK
jgi:hypothetical protein